MKESNLSELIMEELRKNWPRVWCFKYPASSGYARRGIPDIVACIRGNFVAIETKLTGGKLTEIQKFNLAQIGKCGGIPIVLVDCDGLKQLRALLQEGAGDLWLTRLVKSSWKDFELQPIWLGKKKRQQKQKQGSKK